MYFQMFFDIAEALVSSDKEPHPVEETLPQGQGQCAYHIKGLSTGWSSSQQDDKLPRATGR